MDKSGFFGSLGNRELFVRSCYEEFWNYAMDVQKRTTDEIMVVSLLEIQELVKVVG